MPGPATAFYSKYLSAKIASCDRTASMFSAYHNARMKELAEMRAAQAEFYKENRADLIEAMLSRRIGKKVHQIDYFLVNQFTNRHRLARCK